MASNRLINSFQDRISRVSAPLYQNVILPALDRIEDWELQQVMSASIHNALGNMVYAKRQYDNGKI